MGRPRRMLFMLVTLLLVGPPAAAQEGLGAKQAEAAAIKAKIETQGRRLSIANEDYNQAVLRRKELDVRAARVGAEVAAAEARYRELTDRLGQRVRVLYMHPGAQVDAWLGTMSFDRVSRVRVLSTSVLEADAGLVRETEEARERVRSQAAELGALRDAARASERDLATKRQSVARELAAQRALLARVNGEIARLIEAERQRQLEEAARLAAEEAARRAAAEATPVPSGATPGPSEPPPASNIPPSARGAKAVETARAQIGKPYEWAGEGPNSFDCSGLTAYAWRSAGVSLPHSSRAQYESLPKVSRSQIRPGDLLFYGSPIHHVGIYEGSGIMINAPQTGETVRRDSINRSDYVGATRPG